MAPDSIPIRASLEAKDEPGAIQAQEALAEDAELAQASQEAPGEQLEAQPAARPPGKHGLRDKLLARKAQQAQEAHEQQEAWQMPGSTIYELRSNIKIQKGQVMKIQLLDAQKGCSVSLQRSAKNEFLEWAGDPYLYGSVFSSGILQTVLQRKARIGTLVLVFIIAFFLGGLTLGGLI